MKGSDGGGEGVGVSLNIMKRDVGVGLEGAPVETDGLSATKPLGSIEVKQPDQVRGPAPRKRFNCVRHKA